MGKTLAEKTEWLFQHVPGPDGQSYSSARLAARIEQLCPGFTVTPATIWNIRTGKSDNPSGRVVEGMAKAFGVSPQYFADDEETDRTQEEVALLAALRDAGVRGIALRAQGLSSESLQTVRDLIERVRQLEGVGSSRGRETRAGPPESAKISS
jgi:transcriptional regulator with XRE-family HTH domain